jgi:hypothetical protein
MSANQITIPHVLGAWTVEILPNCADVPQGCSDWHSFGTGYKHQGHAVGYVKRLAKNSPDKSSRWVIYEFNQRWFVAIRKDLE